MLNTAIAARISRKKSRFRAENEGVSGYSLEMSVEEVQKNPLCAVGTVDGRRTEIVAESETVAEIMKAVFRKHKVVKVFNFETVKDDVGILRITIDMGSEITPVGSVNARLDECYWFITTIGKLNTFLPNLDAAYLQSYFWTDRFLLHAKIVEIDVFPASIFYSACNIEKARGDFTGRVYVCHKCGRTQEHHNVQLKINISLEDETGQRQSWPCMILGPNAEALLGCSSAEMFQLSKKDPAEMTSRLHAVREVYHVFRMTPHEYMSQYKYNIDEVMG